MRKRLVPLLLLIVLPGCYSYARMKADLAPVTVNRQRFEPPAQYAVWYRELEVCTGLKGDFSKLVFFTADDIQGAMPAGAAYIIGYWWWGELYYRTETLNSLGGRALERFIKHEMIHDLAWRGAHVLWHDPRYFSAKCVDSRGRG